MIKRANALAWIRIAGYHGDHREFARLFIESRISKSAADDAILRPFYGCPPEELSLAWDAALLVAAARLRKLTAAPHPPAQQAEPLFLLHTGEIDSSGEQAEWEIEHDSQQRVDALCALNPGVTVKLYAGAPPHKADGAEPTAGYLVETEKGPMYWPADQAGLEEACTYCDDDEEPVELIRRPHKAEGAEQ